MIMVTSVLVSSLLPKAIDRMTMVSTSCEIAVEPVARSHKRRGPVSFLMKKKAPMSTYCAVRNATIDAIWMRVAFMNTLSNAAGVMLPSAPQLGLHANGTHGAWLASWMISTTSPVMAKASRVTWRAVRRP
jgi:hypothetical protein